MHEKHNWQRPDTHFTLLLRESGDQYGVATGEISCTLCHAVGLHIEHLDHEVWCRNAEDNHHRLSARTPMGWIVPRRPERPGHDPRVETAMVAARTRVLNPMDYGDHTDFSVAESLDFFGQFVRRVETFHDRRGQHDWNDLDWRLDELDPAEVNAPAHRATEVGG